MLPCVVTPGHGKEASSRVPCQAKASPASVGGSYAPSQQAALGSLVPSHTAYGAAFQASYTRYCIFKTPPNPTNSGQTCIYLQLEWNSHTTHSHSLLPPFGGASCHHVAKQPAPTMGMCLSIVYCTPRFVNQRVGKRDTTLYPAAAEGWVCLGDPWNPVTGPGPGLSDSFRSPATLCNATRKKYPLTP